LRLYLTGFLESRIRPESQKITQKVACEKYDDSAFTLLSLRMFMVDIPLPAAPPLQVTENPPMSYIAQSRAINAGVKQNLPGVTRASHRQRKAKKTCLGTPAKIKF
jgi:hypothetical protein